MKTALRNALWMAALVAGAARAHAQTISVDGEGYLRLVVDGQVVYAKSVKVARINGRLGAEGGAAFIPAIDCPSTPSSLKIDLNGTVWCSGQCIGKLVLAQFKSVNPVADGRYMVSSVRPDLVNPGDGTAGVIRFGGVNPAPAPVKPTTQSTPVARPARLPGKVAATTTPPKAPVATGLTIQVNPGTELNTDKFTLGQVAKISGDPVLVKVAEGLVLGDTPPVGIDRVIDGVRIRGLMRQAGFDPAKVQVNVPGGAKVYRESQSITPEQLTQTATDAANAILGQNGTLRASGPLMTLRVPKGSLELVCNNTTENQNQVRCLVDIYVDGKRYNAATVLLTRENAHQKLMVGATVTVRCLIGSLAVETSGKVTKTGSKATDPVEVKTSDGAVLTGVVNSHGEVEVSE